MEGNSGNAVLKPVVIKRYANRKLYNTTTSQYVTLSDIGALVASNAEVRVIDNRTKEDLTGKTLLAAKVLKEEAKNLNDPQTLNNLRSEVQALYS